MIPTPRLTLSALCATILVALSLSATTPALARGGGWMVHQTTKFMMKNGARFNMNTREEAWAGRSRPVWNQVAENRRFRATSRPRALASSSN